MNNFKLKTNKVKHMKCSFLFCIIICSILVCCGAEQNNLQIIARGIGQDTVSATKDALAQAVQQAVGAFVDSETLIKNDEIVSDQILTYSDGFVTRYEVLKQKNNTLGFVEVTIKAQVEQKKLREKLDATNVLRIEVADAQNVWAQIETENLRRENAEQILIKTFSLLKPLDYLIPVLIDSTGKRGAEAQLQAINLGDGNVQISMGLCLLFNHAKFVKETLPHLEMVFDKICIEKSAPFYSTAHDNSDRRSVGFNVNEKGIMSSEQRTPKIVVGASYSRSFENFRTGNWRDYVSIYLNISRRYTPANQKFVYYRFPFSKNLDDFLKKHKNGSDHLRAVLCLKDAAGEEIYAKQISLDQSRYPSYDPLISDMYQTTISPEFLSSFLGAPSSFSNVDLFDFSFQIPAADYRDVKSMEVFLEENKK